MLWNIIFEFFVKYIFGGVLIVDGSTISYNGTLGVGYWLLDGDFDDIATISTAEVFGYSIPINTETPNYIFNMPLGNYFSLIATIITLIVILLVCFHIIKKCFNVFTRIL